MHEEAAAVCPHTGPVNLSCYEDKDWLPMNTLCTTSCPDLTSIVSYLVGASGVLAWGSTDITASGVLAWGSIAGGVLAWGSIDIIASGIARRQMALQISLI